jgi:hypothetical protein
MVNIYRGLDLMSETATIEIFPRENRFVWGAHAPDVLSSAPSPKTNEMNLSL